MRSALLLASIMLVSSLALAERTGGGRGGGGGGGGRLGAVSSGIDRATSSSSPSKSSSSSSVRDHRDEPSSSSSSASDDDASTTYYASPSSTPSQPFEWPDIDVDADGFAGGQKVFESDGSLTAELALVFDRRVRVGGGASHYFEETTPTRRVSMTVPSFAVGMRVSPAGPTRVWIDGGVVHVRTSDPAGSSSITGTQFNARLERDFGANTMLLGQAGAWLFEDLQALTARAAVRFHHVEVGVRYLDFTVGPPLWGPEIGVAF
jgi:hypothetical protein